MLDLALVVDQDSLERRFIAATLASDGLNVVQITGSIQGVLAVIDWQPRLVVISEDSAPVSIGDMLTLIRRLTTAPVIIIGEGGPPDELDSLSRGGDVYLTRPVSASQVLLRVRSILGREREQARRETRISLEQVIGRSWAGDSGLPAIGHPRMGSQSA